MGDESLVGQVANLSRHATTVGTGWQPVLRAPHFLPTALSRQVPFVSASFGGKGRSMLRTALGVGAMLALLAATGCRMCVSPYDYCGPVYEGQGCSSCGSEARAGSILAGGSQPSPAPVLAPAPQTSSAPVRRQVQGQMQFGDVPGSERIVSVTDRVVGSSTTAADSSNVATDSSPDSPQSLPSQGWTAAPDARRTTIDRHGANFSPVRLIFSATWATIGLQRGLPCYL